MSAEPRVKEFGDDAVSLDTILNDSQLTYDLVFAAVAAGKICPFYDFATDTIWFSSTEVTALLLRSTS